MPQGTAVHRTHGRNLPQRVLVRSAITPMIGSKNASHSRPTSSSDPAAAAADAQRVGVEIQLEQNHRHEDEVRGGVAQAVAGLFDERKFLRLTRSRLIAIASRLFHRRGSTFCKSPSRDELPTMISNSPGSTTNFMSMS